MSAHRAGHSRAAAARPAILLSLFFSWIAPAQAQEAELVRRLEPLSVRGINYYPRQTPWSRMWLETPPEIFEQDMAVAASLNANTVRTFLHFSPKLQQAGWIAQDGTPQPAYLGKIDSLLAAAWKHRIRLILCFEFNQDLLMAASGERWRRALECVLATHRNDGRVLLWDLMNEPDDKTKWTPVTRDYLKGSLALAGRLDTNHATTIGLAWRSSLLLETGLPDVLQYHEYSPKQEIFGKGRSRINQSIAGRLKVGPDRPLLIGEFGMSTARDEKYGVPESLRHRIGAAPGTEQEQARLYDIVLEAAQGQRITGVLAWCLYDFPIDNPDESHFGLVRHDGSLKPAAIILRQAYQRWRESKNQPE